MVSTTETGHAKNVATFEDLISFCRGYNGQYNPSKAALQLTALITQHQLAKDALQLVKNAKTDYNNATNEREIVFEPLRPLATKIVSALAATDATRQTVDDAKSINLKIQGRRATAIAKPDAAALAAGTEPVKTASTSQQSYDKLIDHLEQLLATLTADDNYIPNEEELKTASIDTLLSSMRAKNTAVIETTTALSNARIARDKALYAEGTGLIDTALAVKTYVKSVFGATSPQYKQVSGLKFTRITGD